ncbi:MAG TPA: 1,4-alpha-glucan branching enzyme, partial [Candidatus Rifleibacterium sp.]|nr:1,4-alpha-glucan branching enzyme [Candidatus Rifleibacterium sp.]
MNQIINSSAIQAIVRTDHHDPFQILGAHVAEFKGKKCVAVRAFLPDAEKVEVIDIANGMPFKMNRLDDAGFFEAVILDRTSVFAYRLKSF